MSETRFHIVRVITFSVASADPLRLSPVWTVYKPRRTIASGLGENKGSIMKMADLMHQKAAWNGEVKLQNGGAVMNKSKHNFRRGSKNRLQELIAQQRAKIKQLQSRTQNIKILERLNKLETELSRVCQRLQKSQRPPF